MTVTDTLSLPRGTRHVLAHLFGARRGTRVTGSARTDRPFSLQHHPCGGEVGTVRWKHGRIGQAKSSPVKSTSTGAPSLRLFFRFVELLPGEAEEACIAT